MRAETKRIKYISCGVVALLGILALIFQRQLMAGETILFKSGIEFHWLGMLYLVVMFLAGIEEDNYGSMIAGILLFGGLGVLIYFWLPFWVSDDGFHSFNKTYSWEQVKEVKLELTDGEKPRLEYFVVMDDDRVNLNEALRYGKLETVDRMLTQRNVSFRVKSIVSDERDLKKIKRLPKKDYQLLKKHMISLP